MDLKIKFLFILVTGGYTYLSKRKAGSFSI